MSQPWQASSLNNNAIKKCTAESAQSQRISSSDLINMSFILKNGWHDTHRKFLALQSL